MGGPQKNKQLKFTVKMITAEGCIAADIQQQILSLALLREVRAQLWHSS